VFDLLVDFLDETLDAVVFAVGDEVGEVNWLLAMRLRSWNQPQSTYTQDRRVGWTSAFN